MCLHLRKNTKKKIADKDIVCYKVLFYDETDKTHAVSQFEGFDYMLGRLEYTQLDSPDAIHRVFFGFHSYKYYEDALESIYAYGGLLDCNCENFEENRAKVYTCIIPKGSDYYEGIQPSMPYDMVGYCSNQIVIQEVATSPLHKTSKLVRRMNTWLKHPDLDWKLQAIKVISLTFLFSIGVCFLGSFFSK
jgi:hypothetical protein